LVFDVLTPVWSGRFKRDVRRTEKRGKDMDKLKAVLLLLIEQKPLPASYNDHPLKGDWRGFRDLHIEPDWLLLYRVDGNELQLARTGTHTDLFDE
jgi:mRNA interferase YafQ